VASNEHLEALNAAQRAAVECGITMAPRGARPLGSMAVSDPAAALRNLDASSGNPGGGGRESNPALLIIAGAGSGKTHTLAHRVAHLILNGAQPDRILLLTFTRRAASEMERRARRIQAEVMSKEASKRSRGSHPGPITWAGTFHSVANRLLRLHAESVGLDPSFTVLDRGDSEDLIDLLRTDLDLSTKGARFPRKGTCLAIYSHVVNAQQSIEATLEKAFPWCDRWVDELKQLFASYTEAKQKRHVLDYDDLLLYWYYLMEEPALAALVGGRFDYVLVDEYQDTNALQAAVLARLAPTGRGLTVVGDDAQSIYSFRAASVRNILDFPKQFETPAEVITLEENYRSTRPILAACNAVIDEAPERFAKQLYSSRRSEERPELVSVPDEAGQVEYVVERVLAHREAGLDLKRQAVLFRTSHHSDVLEVELSRRQIPFVKYGGLRFLEAAHVKDVLCLLRWAENPHDEVAAFRALQLLPGVGPGYARRAWSHHEAAGFDVAALRAFRPPAAAGEDWPGFAGLLAKLRASGTDWQAQFGMVRRWYEPQLERLHGHAHVRAGDLDQLEQISANYDCRERFLSEVTLDPPSASADEAGDPLLDEDYLILSTVHSAKGQEWDAVFVLNVVDGCIPSDMSTGQPEQVEEERRLLYVAMTRARNHLHLVQPLRFYTHHQHRHGDHHVYAPRSRFLTEPVLECFERSSVGVSTAPDEPGARSTVKVDVASRLRSMWS
jgi:DNA helicase-2/ATP-dependent DNA helicase PcrA